MPTSLPNLPSNHLRVARLEAPVPEALAVALAHHVDAAERFAALSPSCRREYCEWIASAKREATRDSRVTQALARIIAGKSR